jgi:uncharacterized repeat protein (TIGR03803 family)
MFGNSRGYLGVFLSVAAVSAAIPAAAQTYSVLANLNTSNGLPKNVAFDPISGNLYGITGEGGSMGFGGLYVISPDGQFSTVYDFIGGADGAGPNYLARARDGVMYVTTRGSTGCGTLDAITSSGDETTMLDFTGSNGCAPTSLTICTKSILCGTTQTGGTADDGVVYTIKPHAPLPKEHIVADFSAIGGGCSLLGGSIVWDPFVGTIYGTTESGGAYGHGCLFKLTPDGNITTLHSFDGSDGDNPIGPLAYDYANGKLSGATFSGGTYGYGTVWSYDLSTNTWTVTKNFDGSGPTGQASRSTSGVPGANPNGGMIIDGKGNLFGTTVYGGGGTACAQGCGEVFELTASGKFKVLYAFNGTDGEYPVAPLALGKAGDLYGTTLLGGTGGSGVVFKIAR